MTFRPEDPLNGANRLDAAKAIGGDVSLGHYDPGELLTRLGRAWPLHLRVLGAFGAHCSHASHGGRCRAHARPHVGILVNLIHAGQRHTP